MGCDRRSRVQEDEAGAAESTSSSSSSGGSRMEVPSYFKCPISLCLMADPVSICTGITYDRSSIEKWLDEGRNTCPVTMQLLQSHDLIPNHTLRRIIQAWCSTNGVACSSDLAMAPQPRTKSSSREAQLPVGEAEAKQLVAELSGSPAARSEALKRMGQKCREGAKSRERLAAAGAAAALVALLLSNPGIDEEQQQEVVILLSQVGLDEAGKKSIMNSSSSSLATISWLLQRGPLAARISAASLLEELAIAPAKEWRLAIGATEGVFEGLARLIREDHSHRSAVRASLRAVLAICAPMKNRIRLVESGVMAPLVELLPESDRVVTESVLAVLECLCGCAEGRAAVSRHALAVPAVTKKLFKVSDMATEYAIDVLWAVCKYSPDEGVRKRMVEVGLFPKLFFFLQIGCNPRTKHKAGDLLKLLHRAYRDCCIEENNNNNNTCLLSS